MQELYGEVQDNEPKAELCFVILIVGLEVMNTCFGKISWSNGAGANASAFLY